MPIEAKQFAAGKEAETGQVTLILAGKFGVRFCGRGCVVDERIWVRPRALLETVNVIAQDVEVRIEDEGVAFEFGIING